MADLLERIAGGEVLVSDGAMGTFLQARGLKPGECPEAWCITHADVVRGIAEAYVSAGSNIIETNSFGGTKFKLQEFGCDAHVAEYNKAAAEIAKSAIGDAGFVAASVGPTGQIAEEEGGWVDKQQLYDAFAEQIQALVEGGADALCIETMSSIIEAAQAVKASKAISNRPVICTFTFEKGLQGYRTMMGANVSDAVTAAIHFGADIVGANCGNGIEGMLEIVKEIRAAASETPIMIQANAGKPILENGSTVFRETPADMAARVEELMKEGVSIIGGCCGTTPDHIKAISDAVARISGRV